LNSFGRELPEEGGNAEERFRMESGHLGAVGHDGQRTSYIERFQKPLEQAGWNEKIRGYAEERKAG
jgi:hypothetical protein